MRLIVDLLKLNMSKDELQDYLARKVACRDEARKVIAQFWKQESPTLLEAIKAPTLSCDAQGIADVDWEIQSTMAARRVQSVGQQSATIVV